MYKFKCTVWLGDEPESTINEKCEIPTNKKTHQYL